MTHSTEQEIAAAWNAQADEFNQWDELDLQEKIEWAAKFGKNQAARRAQVVPEGLAKHHLITGVKQPAIRYDLLYAYADKHRLHFNDLCNLVREAVAAAPQPPACSPSMKTEPATKMEKAPPKYCDLCKDDGGYFYGRTGYEPCCVWTAGCQPPDWSMSEKRTTKPEAAPVQMPEEDAGWFKYDRVSRCWHPQYSEYAEKYAKLQGWQKLYAEHQVRQLLASHGVT